MSDEEPFNDPATWCTIVPELVAAGRVVFRKAPRECDDMAIATDLGHLALRVCPVDE